MNDIRTQAALSLIHPLSGFENAKMVELEEGHAVVSYEISKTALNPLGNVHGGFLFTLCDISAGMVSASLGKVSVTLNSSISYIKGLSHGTLFFEATNLHCGRKTLVVDLKVTDTSGELICKGTYTMFILKDME